MFISISFCWEFITTGKYEQVRINKCQRFKVACRFKASYRSQLVITKFTITLITFKSFLLFVCRMVTFWSHFKFTQCILTTISDTISIKSKFSFLQIKTFQNNLKLYIFNFSSHITITFNMFYYISATVNIGDASP